MSACRGHDSLWLNGAKDCSAIKKLDQTQSTNEAVTRARRQIRLSKIQGLIDAKDCSTPAGQAARIIREP
jgi:hypothetical protein